MLSKEFCASVHCKELIFNHPQIEHDYNAIVLASIEKGISIKPYPMDEEEKEKLIIDYAYSCGCSYEYAKLIIEDPEFCFVHADIYCDEDEIKQIIHKATLYDAHETNRAVCPYA